MKSKRKKIFYKKYPKDEQGVRQTVLRLGKRARTTMKGKGDDNSKRKVVIWEKHYNKPGESGWKETKHKFVKKGKGIKRKVNK